MADAPTVNEHGYPITAHYPPYVQTEAERERWDLVTKIAEAYVALYEDHPDPHFVWYATRQWYFSDIPTGSPDDPPAVLFGGPPEIKSGPSNALPEPNRLKTEQPIAHSAAQSTPPTEPPVQEAELDSKDKQKPASGDRAAEMFAEIQAKRPAPGSPREEFIEATGRIVDLLDELFGDPDQYDFGEQEVTPLEEAIAGMIHGAPYKELLHPRDRLGKWTQKLAGLHNVITKDRQGIKQTLAAHVAAARVKLSRKGQLAPSATPEQVAAAHRALVSGKAEREHFLALASEQRQRQGVRGAARKVERQATEKKGMTMMSIVSALAYIGSEEGEKKHPLVVPVARGAEEMNEFKDRAEITYEQAHRMAEFVMEHRVEIGAMLRAGMYHLARAKGLVQAEAEVEDDEVAEAEQADFDTAEDVLLTLGYT